MKYFMKNRYNFWIAWTIAVIMIISFRINKKHKSTINTNQFNPLKLWQEQIQHTQRKSTYQS